jgi:hypothetical protein
MRAVLMVLALVAGIRAQMQWVAQSSPLPFGPVYSAFYDGWRDRVVVVVFAAYGVTYEFDGQNWFAVPISAAAVEPSDGAFDPVRGVTVIYDDVPNCFWEWDGASWT